MKVTKKPKETGKIKRKPKEMKSFKNNIQSDSLIPAENLGEPYNYGDINNKKR